MSQPGGAGGEKKWQPRIADKFFDFHVAIYAETSSKKNLMKVTLEKLCM